MKTRNNMLILLLFSLLVISPNYFDLSHEDNVTSLDSIDIEHQNIIKSISNYDNSILSDRYSINSIKVNSNDVMKVNDFQGSNTALLGIENQTSDSGFAFEYIQSETDDGTLTNNANNYNFTVTSLNSTGYDTLEIDIDAYTPSMNFTVEKDSADLAPAMQYYDVYSQGAVIPALQYSQSSTFINRFNLSIFLGASGVDLIGEVWSSVWNGTVLTPGSMLQTASVPISFTTDIIVDYIFDNPVPINSTNTYTNSTGGYIFFTIRRNDTLAGDVALKAQNYGTDVMDGLTYSNQTINTANVSPSKPSDWTEENFDLTIEYSASFEFNPYDINTIVAEPIGSAGTLVKTDGNYTDTTFRSAPTTYRIKYDDTKVFGYTTFLNISYTKYLSTDKLAGVSYSVSPKYSELNWTIGYSNTFTNASVNIRQLFYLPNNFTDITVYNGPTLLTLGVDYLINPGNINQTVRMLITTGDYIIHANSTNLLNKSNIQNYVFDGANWDNNDTAIMGVVYPSLADGDEVNSTILDLALLKITGGSVNSSLRAQDGTLFDTVINPLSTSITYSTILKPNMVIGVYSFQHYWFNGTAGGATSAQILIKPKTTITFLTSTVLDALEGDVVPFSLTVHDESHDNGLEQATKYLQWSFDTYTTNFTTLNKVGSGGTGNNIEYSGTIDTSKIANAVKPETYNIRISFEIGDYVEITSFDINVYYRGSADIQGPTVMDEGGSISLQFRLLNDTDGGIAFNTSGLTIDANVSSTVNYLPVSEYYEVVINWAGNNFRIGYNQIEFNWTHPDFRSIAGQNYTLVTFDFLADDTVNPQVISSSSTGYGEGTTTKLVQFNTTENNPDYYEVRMISNSTSYDGSVPYDTVPTIFDWTSDGTIEINFGGYPKGEFDFEIKFTDLSERSVIATLSLVVLDDSVPAFNTAGPADTSIDEFSDYSIVWDVSDNYADVYNLTINGVLTIKNAVWTSADNVSVQLSSYQAGIYNFTIEFYDKSGNVLKDTVIITIEDNVDPIFVDKPSSTVKSFTNSSLILDWNATDTHPDTYELYQDGTLVISGSWTGNITLEIENLTIGEYNFTLVVYDKSLNYVTQTIIATIKDPALIETATPQISHVENVYEGSYEEIEVSWRTSINDIAVADASVNYTLVVDNIPSQPNMNSTQLLSFIREYTGTSYRLILNYTGLLPGEYYWLITFFQDGYETSQTIKLIFTVLPHELDVIISTDPVFTQGKDFRISVEIRYSNPSGITLNGLVNTRAGAVSGLNMTLILSFIDNNGVSSSLTFDLLTGTDGIDAVLISGDTTSGIKELTGLQVNMEESDIYNTSEIINISGDKLPEVVLSVNEIPNVFETILSSITELFKLYKELILALIFVIILIIVLVSIQIKKQKTRKKLYNRLKIKTTDEIVGLYNLNAIVMKSTFTGLQFYERLFDDAMNLDLALLSGITTAITNVLSEIREDEMGFEVMERSGLSITMYKGKMVTFIMVSNDVLPDVIKYQIEEAHSAFEKKYAEYSENTQLLNLIHVDEINELLGNYIKIALKEDLVINVGKIAKIKDKKSINRSIRNNLRLLTELNKMVEMANLPISLHTLFEFLKSKEIDSELIYQLISTSYAYGIIETSTN